MAFLYRVQLLSQLIPVQSCSATTITHFAPTGPAYTNNITHVGKQPTGKSAPPTPSRPPSTSKYNTTDPAVMPWEETV